jgi:hypothetical protein
MFLIRIFSILVIMCMATGRVRHKGDVMELVAVVTKYASKPNFIGYSEDMNAKKAPVKLKPFAAMFKELQQIAPRLVFTQKFLEEACTKSYEALRLTWQRDMSAEQLQTWATATSKQIRVACRHITQSMDTAWVKSMLATEQDGDNEEDGEDAEEGGEEEPAEGDEVVEAEDEEVIHLQTCPLILKPARDNFYVQSRALARIRPGQFPGTCREILPALGEGRREGGEALP